MSVSCICGHFGKPAPDHENDCPVRRAWQKGLGGGAYEAAIKPPDLTVREDGVVVPTCTCGLGSTKPAYRHARSCPVYRAWVERERPPSARDEAGRCRICGAGEGAEHAGGCVAWLPLVKAYMPPAFTVGQAVRTPAGSRGRVISVDAKGDWPVVALIEDGSGESPRQFNEHGWCRECAQYGPERNKEHDLLPAPRRAVVWVRGRWDAGGKYDCWLGDKRLGKPDGNSVATFEIRVELEEGRFDD